MLNWRKIEEKLVKLICLLAMLFGAFMLIFIIGSIFYGAIPSLSLYFLITAESQTQHLGQGIANAVVGTIIISICSTIFAIPLAIGTAIYMRKYASPNWATETLRFFIEVLSGTPSIVIGMFGFLVFVYYMKSVTGGYSLIAGSIALGILIIPVIERATEHAIESVSKDIEEASYALGATKWQTIKWILVPTALSGIITGIILGFGRAAEESAVVIMTAGYTQFLPEFAIKSNNNLIFGMKIYPFQDLVATLPYAVYHAYENSNIIPMSNGYAAAFFLIIIVLLINLLAKTILWGAEGGFKSRSWSIGKILKNGLVLSTTTTSNPKDHPPQKIDKKKTYNHPQYSDISIQSNWLLGLYQPVPTGVTHKTDPRIPDRTPIHGKNVEEKSPNNTTEIEDLLEENDETPEYQTDILEFSEPFQSEIEPMPTEQPDQNTQVFLRYSISPEEFAMFEERPVLLPERNSSLPEQERWRLMQRNREENSCP
jgi:phosphate transport system permease protein